MKATERAVRAELRRFPPEIGGGALGRAAIDLGKRLDAGPADTTATLLIRELRLVLADLREQARGEGVGAVEAFLAGVSTSAFDAGH